MLAADEMRKEGVRAGVVGIRVLRPFPFIQVQEALKHLKAVGTLDRSAPGGTLGMLYNEVGAALYQAASRPVLTNYIYGLGGRDITIGHLKEIFRELKENADASKPVHPIQQFVNLRGPKLSFY